MSSRFPVRPIDQAVTEALEARCATEYAADFLKNAAADGEVTLSEALEAVRLIEHALVEAKQVVPTVERANELQKLGLQFAMYGEVAPHAERNAATVGIDVGVLTAAGD